MKTTLNEILLCRRQYGIVWAIMLFAALLLISLGFFKPKFMKTKLVSLLIAAAILAVFTGCASAGSTVVNVASSSTNLYVLYSDVNQSVLTNDPPPQADIVATNVPPNTPVLVSGLNAGTHWFAASTETTTGQSSPSAPAAAVIPTNAVSAITISP